MRSVKKVLEKIMAAEVVIGGLLIILMVGIMVLEFIMRYIFNNSIIWVQEFVIMVFIWITMLGSSAALMTKTHVTITTFSQFISGKGKAALQLLISFVIFGVLIYLALYLPESIRIQNKTFTSSMPINIAKGHYYSTPLFCAVILMLITQLYYLYYEIIHIAGKKLPDDYILQLNIPFLRIKDVEEDAV
ncbi:MAG: TRAP transporter small permease subunit [Sphaerochaetaceae bacterium]|nr:TRAP transporter small permease subunit [Sphaerochaetaceae bacterium]